MHFALNALILLCLEEGFTNKYSQVFCFNLFLHLILVLRLSCFSFSWLFSVSLTGTKSPFLCLSQLFIVQMLQPGVALSGR